MSACSLASASSVTRPCCSSTRLKWLATSNVMREKSPFIGSSPFGDRSAFEDDVDVHAGRCVLGEPGAQVGLALGLEQIMERAHLGFVIGAAHDLGRAAGAELGVGGLAVPHAAELRPDAQQLA